MSIAEKLKSVRKEMNFTQEDLSNKSKVSISTIKKIESENRIPKLETLEKIANALNVSSDYLLGKVDWSTYDDPKAVAVAKLFDNGFDLDDLIENEISLSIDNKPITIQERKALSCFLDGLRALRK